MRRHAVYANRYPGDTAYLAWLERRAGYADRCAFATAPDVVADAQATLARSLPMLGRIRAAGYPAALVAQDGLGTSADPVGRFRRPVPGRHHRLELGPAAAQLAAQARQRGLWAYMGRVNSPRRLHHAEAIGCHSADGTILAFGPTGTCPHF